MCVHLLSFASKRLSRIVIALSAIACIVSGQCQAVPVNAVSARSAAVRFVEVQARSGIPLASSWAQSELKSGPILTDLQGRVVGYCFLIFQSDKALGYVLVAGDTDLPPVLEWSFGPCPYQDLPEACRKFLGEYGAQNGLGEYTTDLVYASPGRTLSRVTWPGAQKSDHIWCDLQAATAYMMPFPSLFDPFSGCAGVVSGASSKATSTGSGNGYLRTIEGIPWFSYFRSSHVTTSGMVLSKLGAQGGNEVTKGFLARFGNFLEHCLCDRPDKPWTSIITAGTANFCRIRNLAIGTHEFVVKGPAKPETLDFAGYKALIDAGKPVVLTYSGDRLDASDFEHAKLRLYTVSALGYGYLSDSTGDYAVAYFPSNLTGERTAEVLPQTTDRPGFVFIAWNAPASSILAVVFEKQ